MGYRRGVPKTCLLCDRISIGRGLCRNHYLQHRKAGTLKDFPTVQPWESFINRVRKTDSCWLWTGTHNSYGYGIFLLPGEVPVRAHRYAYELWKGPIPDGYIVMHSCDNPPCVNPAHLSVGTKLDNNRDAGTRGRRPTGPAHWRYTLTAEHIKAIRADPRKQVEIAKDYGVSASTISVVKTHKRRFAKK